MVDVSDVQSSDALDVAISFLARDERIASDLHDLLGGGTNVFFFPRKQEELAGTNGLESMRAPFQAARVVVVLFRHPWGETNWTRVEQEAITDRFLKQGWKWLLFVQLDATSKLPAWLPDTHVRFALEQYGIDQLAGAVKMRVQEMGGTISPPTALSKARQVQREAALIADQTSFFRDVRWIEANIHSQLKALMVRIAEISAEINQELGMQIEARPEGMRCILRASGVCMNVGWRQSILNSVTEQAGLIAAEFNGHLYLPAERMMTAFQPKELRRSTFLPSLSFSRDVRWQEQGKAGAHPLPVEDVAQLIVSKFLDLVARANRGEVHFVAT